uniref:Uncharacterized protein n=1 Tax=Populus davidiana TaxID=266767 RepID=A0A6M2EJK6_9ROSI
MKNKNKIHKKLKKINLFSIPRKLLPLLLLLNFQRVHALQQAKPTREKKAQTAYDFNFSSLFFFRSVFFFLVRCSFLSQLADLRKEALAGWRLDWEEGGDRRGR